MSSAGRAIKTVVHLKLPLQAEGCLIEKRRVAVKASLSLGLNAALKGSVKASGSASFHQATCVQELISGNGRLAGTSMLFNRRPWPPALAGP